MLVHEGDERSIVIDIKLAAIMAAVAGAMNSAGFHTIGVFTANMTGNASLVSGTLATGAGLQALGFFGVIAVFIGGAFTASRIIDGGKARRLRGIYAYVIASEAVALIILGGVLNVLPEPTGPNFLIFGLAFLMGLQNATTTKISNARVRTTHISGMTTDLGIGLAALSRRNHHTSPDAAVKVRLHAWSITAFVGGGVIGVLLYDAITGWLLVSAGTLLLAATASEIWRAKVM